MRVRQAPILSVAAMADRKRAFARKALETVALMLGTDKSRGYCLEMICADFLAGSATQENQYEVLVLSLERLYQTLSDDRRDQVLNRLREGPWKDCVKSGRASY